MTEKNTFLINIEFITDIFDKSEHCVAFSCVVYTQIFFNLYWVWEWLSAFSKDGIYTSVLGTQMLVENIQHGVQYDVLDKLALNATD